MADIVHRLDNLNIERAVSRHVEELALLVILPVCLTGKAHAALAFDDVHALGLFGVEMMRRRKHHPCRLFLPVFGVEGVADALAAVIDVRLRNKANVIKVFHSEVAVRRECPGLQSQIEGPTAYVGANTAPAALPLSGAELLDKLRHLPGVGVDIDGALQHMR